jgi:hypothetical protein
MAVTMDRKPTVSVFYKQPDEKFVIAGDFTDELTTGEAISVSSSDISAVDSDGNDATSTVLSGKEVDGAYLKTTVLAGTENGGPYKITFKAVTDLGNVWEIDVRMKIADV